MYIYIHTHTMCNFGISLYKHFILCIITYITEILSAQILYYEHDNQISCIKVKNTKLAVWCSGCLFLLFLKLTVSLKLIDLKLSVRDHSALWRISKDIWHNVNSCPVMILIMCVFVYLQGAWYSNLGSFTLPAPAAGHQRETRPVNSPCSRPHPYRQPETRARQLSFPEGGIQHGSESLLYGSGCANHTQHR